MRDCSDGVGLRFLLTVPLLILLSGCSLWTVRSLHGSQSAPGPGQQSFDANTYVNSIWSSRVVPAVRSRAVDITTLVKAIRTNVRAAERKYGHQEGNGPYNFAVKGIGTVVHVDTTSLQGTADITLPPPNESMRASLAIGPVILGTTLRDGVGFIHFGQFVNQIQYADVATALNVRVRTSVLKNIKPSTLKGKTLTYYGVFSYSDLKNILIVPVQLAAGQ